MSFRWPTAALVLAAAACAPSQEQPSPPLLQQSLMETRTALVGVRLRADGTAAIEFVVRKGSRFASQTLRAEDAEFALEVLRKDGGEPLARVSLPPARLCPCGGTRPHGSSDLELPHETLLLARVPYVDGTEELRLSGRQGAAWRTLAQGRVGERDAAK